MNATRTLVPATVALTAILVATGSPAMAKDKNKDGRVTASGSCTGAAWKLKASPEDGRLEVEGEIDSNVAGQQWRWTIRHNGSVSDRGMATTTARSGSFEVERKIVDLAGTDAVVFKAVRDGQVCRGVVNF